MSGRRPLKGGAPRLLGNHGGLEGKDFRRTFDVLAAELGPFTPLQRMEAGRVSAAWLQLQAATRALTAAQRQRRAGKGRRPGGREIERLSRRQGLADSSYSQAITRLQEQCAKTKRPPASGADLLLTAGTRA